MAGEGMDLYVPTYISRGGLAESRARLQRFIRDNRLERYDRVHVFAFLAGAWTFNPLVEARELPNLATVIYDRSPLQERAPRIADEKLHFSHLGEVRLSGIRRRQDSVRADHSAGVSVALAGGNQAYVIYQAA
jgi:hypothetical protein